MASKGLAIYFLLPLLFFLRAPLLLAESNDSRPLKIVYVVSDAENFWRTTREFSQEVAKDLGIELELIGAETRFQYRTAIQQLARREIKPDYVIFPYPLQTGEEILQITNAADIPVFLINGSIPEKDAERIGQPREKYKLWLGHMHPDEQSGGDLLARELTRQQKLKLPNSPSHFIGISGDRRHTPAFLRNLGLENFINESGSKLSRLIYTQWANSHKAVDTLLDQYKGVNIIWTASDQLAVESMEVAISRSLIPNENIFIGGYDWSSGAIEAIQKNLISASLGGHFTEAGWALLLLYDYHHGHDFIDSVGLEHRSQYSIINNANVKDYVDILFSDNWKKIDFQRMSKTHNPDLDHYPFSAEDIIEHYRALTP